jgi:hypothetical protein
VGLLDALITQPLVVSLLNHIRSFNDWAQCMVMEVVGRYRPATEAERFDVLEVGEESEGACVPVYMRFFVCGILSFWLFILGV